MNRRFLDPVFFAFLFVLDVLGWAITLALQVTPQIVVVMAPAFLAMGLLALLRSVLSMDPRRFWGAMVIVTAVFAVFMGLAESLQPDLASLSLSFSPSLTFMAIAFVSSLVGLFLALANAIPVPESASTASTAPKPAPAKPTPETTDASTTMVLPDGQGNE